VRIVSNSGPLIVLAKAGHLGLLHALYGEILIGPTVYAEVVTAGAGQPGAAEVAAAGWVRVRHIDRSEVPSDLLSRLDPGEAETISLAERMIGQVLVILDDHPARRVALARGLHVTGSAGVLVAAKQMGLIPVVRPVLDQLRAAGLYLGDTAYREALARAGELAADVEDQGP
jgi:predicted nucleic acid-binding protein